MAFASQGTGMSVQKYADATEQAIPSLSQAERLIVTVLNCSKQSKAPVQATHPGRSMRPFC
jgi:hypothetical protein